MRPWAALVLLLAAGCGDAALADLRSADDAGGGVSLGTVTFVYSWLVEESALGGAADTELHDRSCAVLAVVPDAFAAGVCVQGTGRLRSGTVVNYGATCSCGYSCRGDQICFEVLDPAVAPWGITSTGAALVPLRSLAAASMTVGETVFLPAWAGQAIPSRDGLGGWLHDGCFRVDDVGAVAAGALSLAAGSQALAADLQRIHAPGAQLEAWTGTPRCAYLQR